MASLEEQEWIEKLLGRGRDKVSIKRIPQNAPIALARVSKELEMLHKQAIAPEKRIVVEAKNKYHQQFPVNH